MINCKYCGHRVFLTDRKCVECGAPAPVAEAVYCAVFGGTALLPVVGLYDNVDPSFWKGEMQAEP